MTGAGDQPASGSTGEGGTDEELAALRERLNSLEAMVEGLQDAVHRQAVQVDARLDDLVSRLDPGEVARSISADARRRGL